MAALFSRWPVGRLKALTLGLLGSGLVLLLVAGAFWIPEHHTIKQLRTATGTVTEYTPRQDPDGKVRFYPRIRFRLPDGTIEQFTGPHGTELVPFSAGEEVPVSYPADDPSKAKLATRGRVYQVAYPVGLAGIIVFDVGCFFWILYHRRLRKQGKAGKAA